MTTTLTFAPSVQHRNIFRHHIHVTRESGQRPRSVVERWAGGVVHRFFPADARGPSHISLRGRIADRVDPYELPQLRPEWVRSLFDFQTGTKPEWTPRPSLTFHMVHYRRTTALTSVDQARLKNPVSAAWVEESSKHSIGESERWLGATQSREHSAKGSRQISGQTSVFCLCLAKGFSQFPCSRTIEADRPEVLGICEQPGGGRGEVYVQRLA
ncbi:hypothetical protein BC826DRAFT_1177589 [Russula brevipes]|nr:hypothetical protein BC826DRAFT_1177589 [Russula brevipes]